MRTKQGKVYEMCSPKPDAPEAPVLKVLLKSM